MTYALDHFQVYSIEPHIAVNRDAELKGQFGSKRVFVGTATHFALPVVKIDSDGKKCPIFDKDAHLVWYKVDPHGQETDRHVWLDNQFGENQQWKIGQPSFLLVPAEKKEPALDFPKELNHFLAYKVEEVLSRHEAGSVTLRDQFLERPAAVRRPKYFAVPVSKRCDGETTPLRDEKYHLAIYRTPRLPHVTKRVVETQFGTEKITTIQTGMLAVPSLKTKVKDA